MANLYNLEIHHPNLVKGKNNYDPSKPKWSAMLVTKKEAQAKEVASMGIKVTEFKTNEGKIAWKFNVSKNVTKFTGEPSTPISVVDMDDNPLPKDNIGNGSIVNVRLFEREYVNKAGKPAISYILMAIQIVKLIEYKPTKPGDFPPAAIEYEDGDVF
jgi:hypothetical protein